MKRITLLDFHKNRTQKTKRWYSLLTFCMMMFVGQMGVAQVSDYSFSQSEGVFTSIATDGDIVTGSEATTMTTHDGSGWTVTIPFSFNFNGGDYTSIYVNSNGGATFGSTTSTSSSVISTTTAYDGAIAVMNRDLWGVFITSGETTSGADVITNVGNFYGLEIGKQLNSVNGIPSGATVTAFDEVAGTITMSAPATSSSTSAVVRYGSGKVFTKTEGTAPNRVFVIEWSGYNDYATTVATSNYMSFQLRLEETSNAISIVYGDYYNASTISRTNQIGLRGATTADYNNRLGAVGNPWAATSPGTANGSTVSRDNTNFPASGLTFSWTPPTCPAPSALTASNPTLTSIDLSWNGVGGASGNYEIKWGVPGFDIDAATAIPVAGLTHTLVGTGGSYQFVVREICAVDDESAWSGRYAFNIPNLGDDCSTPIVVGALPYTTTDDTANYTDNPNIEGSPGSSGCGTTSSYLNGNDVVYAYTAAFDGVIQVKMTPSGTWTGIFAYADCADIGTACIGGAYNSGSAVNMFELNVANGETYYFVISSFPFPQTVAYTLDISQVLCAKPTGVAHTDVTHNSANLSWDVLGDYEINWGTGTFVAGDGANTDTVTATTEFAFSGLNGNTSYRYFVRQNCGGTDGDSEWVGPFTFTTLLTPASIPWLEPFSGTVFPTGWANTSSWTVSTSATIVPGAEESYLYKNIWGTTGTNGAMFSTLRMGLVSAGDILNFNYGLIKAGTTYTANGTISIEVSTDNGVTYSPFQTITHSDDVAWTSSGEYDLSAYAGEYIRIRITATRAGTSDDYYLGFDNFYVGQPITCEAPTALTATDITYDSAVLGWANAGTLFDIEIVEGGTTPTGTPTYTGQANPFTATSLTPSTSYEFYVRQDCGATNGVSIWVGPFAFTTECVPPSLTGTTGDTLCGQGEATLSATADAGALISWYATATGGSKLGEGATFTTPLITETTTFYVEAGNPTPNVIGQIGTATTTSTSGGSSPYYHGWGAVKTQYIYKAEELIAAGLAAGEITSIAFDATTSGSALNNFTLHIGTTEATLATSTHIAGLDLVYSNASQVITVGLNTYTFTTPFVWDGSSNIVVQTSYSNNNTGGTSSSVRYHAAGSTLTTYTYADNKTAAQILATMTGNVDGSGNTATSSNRANAYFNGTGICSSARTEVVATVTTAPDFVLSETTVAICEGETSDAVTITTGATDYDAFAWEPSIGVTGDATNGWTFNPTETTTYTLTASQSAGVCATSVEVTVTVNEAPVLIGIIASATEICEGSSVELIANSATAASYCPVAFPSNVEPITLVAISNISNVTTATINGTPELEDFTSIVGDLEAGTTYPITVNGNTNGTFTNNFYVYIDWNQNGVFTDPGETYSIGSISNNNGSGTPLIGSIAVPSTALNGNTRMRVLKKFSASTNPGSCNTTGFGQAEDYTVNITGGVDLYTYSWSDGTSVVGTTSSLTVSPTATTTYTVIVTGSNGCTSTESVEITVNPTPEQPVIACYETATFNPDTCEWEVTGEQMEGPTAESPQTMTVGQTIGDIEVEEGNLTWYTDEDLTETVEESEVLTEGTYTFWVTQTIEGCESAATEITVEVTLNRNGFDLASFRAYPNPVKDYFNVSYSKEITNVSVINMLGQTVIQKTVNATDTQIDMSSLPTGNYFVKVTIDGAVQTVKVVKQ